MIEALGKEILQCWKNPFKSFLTDSTGLYCFIQFDEERNAALMMFFREKSSTIKMGENNEI